MRAHFLIPIVMATLACDAPGDGGGTATTSDAADTTGAIDAPDETPDTASAPDTAAVPDVVAGAPDAEDDALQTGTPDAPRVGCLSDRDCTAGTLCCTLATSYLSACVPPEDCHAGLHDACLTDAQCAARRPGEWTACCHDLRDRNYCAPLTETCQPLVPCETPADCADNGNETCCTRHPYYGRSFCTSEFFAIPERDCR